MVTHFVDIYVPPALTQVKVYSAKYFHYATIFHQHSKICFLVKWVGVGWGEVVLDTVLNMMLNKCSLQ